MTNQNNQNKNRRTNLNRQSRLLKFSQSKKTNVQQKLPIPYLRDITAGTSCASTVTTPSYNPRTAQSFHGKNLWRAREHGGTRRMTTSKPTSQNQPKKPAKRLRTHLLDALTFTVTFALSIFFSYRFYQWVSVFLQTNKGLLSFFLLILGVSLIFILVGRYTKDSAYRLLCLAALIFNLLLCCSYAKVTFFGIWMLLFYFLFTTLVLFVVLVYTRSEPWATWCSLCRQPEDPKEISPGFMILIHLAWMLYVLL